MYLKLEEKRFSIVNWRQQWFGNDRSFRLASARLLQLSTIHEHLLQLTGAN